MKIIVLVVIYISAYGEREISYEDFKTREACEYARDKYLSDPMGRPTELAFCIPKREEK